MRCINFVIRHECSMLIPSLLFLSQSRLSYCWIIIQDRVTSPAAIDWQWSWGRCAHIRAFQIWSKWMICVCKVNFWIFLTAKSSRYQPLKYGSIDYQMCIFHFLLCGCSRNIREKMMIYINLISYAVDWFYLSISKIKNDDSKLFTQWMDIMCVMTKPIRWYIEKVSCVLIKSERICLNLSNAFDIMKS